MLLNEATARKVRQVVAEITGLRVEAVAYIKRTTNLEFAAFVVHDEHDEEKALEFLTDPRCSYRVTRQTPTRIFFEAVA